jgi:hypothetical protein
MRNDGNPFRNQACDLCRDNPIFRLLQNNAYVLEDRLVAGTTRDVGVGQLLNVIENLTAMPATNLPPWLRGIRKFIPLIVTKDEIGPSWGSELLSE